MTRKLEAFVLEAWLCLAGRPARYRHFPQPSGKGRISPSIANRRECNGQCPSSHLPFSALNGTDVATGTTATDALNGVFEELLVGVLTESFEEEDEDHRATLCDGLGQRRHANDICYICTHVGIL